eukprot:scaffold181953_cov35-Tisochrysis_lutea.AAC.4
MAAFVGHTDDADRCVRPLDRLPSNPPLEICPPSLAALPVGKSSSELGAGASVRPLNESHRGARAPILLRMLIRAAWRAAIEPYYHSFRLSLVVAAICSSWLHSSCSRQG